MPARGTQLCCPTAGRWTGRELLLWHPSAWPRHAPSPRHGSTEPWRLAGLEFVSPCSDTYCSTAGTCCGLLSPDPQSRQTPPWEQHAIQTQPPAGYPGESSGPAALRALAFPSPATETHGAISPGDQVCAAIATAHGRDEPAPASAADPAPTRGERCSAAASSSRQNVPAAPALALSRALDVLCAGQHKNKALSKNQREGQ